MKRDLPLTCIWRLNPFFCCPCDTYELLFSVMYFDEKLLVEDQLRYCTLAQ